MTMGTGLNDNVDVYPAPPVTVVQLANLSQAYSAAHNAAVAVQAAAEQATTDKDVALAALVDGMKSDLRYAENTVDYDNDKLRLIGWAGRKPRTPLSPPGQTQLLSVIEQGEGTVSFHWKAPNTGGKPSAYRVLRRERPAGPWLDVATAVVCGADLTDQERGKEFEFRVVAVNKAGEGEPSNTVLVVL
jgi:hypothetical protein